MINNVTGISIVVEGDERLYVLTFTNCPKINRASLKWQSSILVKDKKALRVIKLDKCALEVGILAVLLVCVELVVGPSLVRACDGR